MITAGLRSKIRYHGKVNTSSEDRHEYIHHLITCIHRGCLKLYISRSSPQLYNYGSHALSTIYRNHSCDLLSKHIPFTVGSVGFPDARSAHVRTGFIEVVYALTGVLYQHHFWGARHAATIILFVAAVRAHAHFVNLIVHLISPTTCTSPTHLHCWLHTDALSLRFIEDRVHTTFDALVQHRNVTGLTHAAPDIPNYLFLLVRTTWRHIQTNSVDKGLGAVAVARRIFQEPKFADTKRVSIQLLGRHAGQAIMGLGAIASQTSLITLLADDVFRTSVIIVPN